MLAIGVQRSLTKNRYLREYFINELNNIRQLLKEGKINEFYAGVKRMTEQMKEQYRKYNE